MYVHCKAPSVLKPPFVFFPAWSAFFHLCYTDAIPNSHVVCWKYAWAIDIRMSACRCANRKKPKLDKLWSGIVRIYPYIPASSTKCHMLMVLMKLSFSSMHRWKSQIYFYFFIRKNSLSSKKQGIDGTIKCKLLCYIFWVDFFGMMIRELSFFCIWKGSFGIGYILLAQL